MLNRKTVVAIVLLVILLAVLFYPMPSYYSDGVQGADLDRPGMTRNTLAPAPPHAANDASYDVSAAGLIPREIVTMEDFGKFSPDAILQGQNYLDPRSQIGYPETIGGVLRNANRDFRSEPINPRTPVSIFNLSTIPPDTMRPKFEISPEYQ
jgi:hypothetical protein